MGKMKNLWESIDFNTIETTDNLVEYLNQQGEYLSEKTNQKVAGRAVTGHYEMIGGVFAGIQGVDSTAKTLAAITGKQRFVPDVDDGVTREDASGLYKQDRCSFEIISNNYRYKAFDLLYGPVFPIRIYIDEDIIKEENFVVALFKEGENPREYILKNFSEFVRCVQQVFSSRKVVYLIKQLMQRQS